MSETAKEKERRDKKETQTEIPPKKRKTEPEVTIAPSGPGGPDVSVE